MGNLLLENQHLLGQELSCCSNGLLKVFAGFNCSVEAFQVEMWVGPSGHDPKSVVSIRRGQVSETGFESKVSTNFPGTDGLT